MEALTPASADCEAQFMLKFLKAQCIALIEFNVSGARSMAIHGSMGNTCPAGVRLGGADLVSNDFHLFLHLKRLLSGQCQHFQNDRQR